MMRPKITTVLKAIILSLGLELSEAFADPANPLPTGGTVTSGQATINQPNTNTLQINQSSQKAIIQWQTFDVGQGHTVNFNTPGANAITLNRVSGASISDIEGHLSSNGQLWLINPNGVMFGSGAQVNVAGLLASTLNISDENFNNGHYQFSASSNTLSKIINQGQITANGGYVALLAPQIGNSGVVSAQLGTIAMGAGTEATLTFSGNQLLNIAVPTGSAVPMYDENGNPVAALSNTGTLAANGGQVLLTSASVNTLLDESINLSGIIKADTVNEINGKIILTASGNTILDNAQISAQGLNSGDTGGSVEVLGHNVGLFDNTTINTSGAAGGGQIHVGWDKDDPNAVEADATLIDQQVILNASATQNGDGGFIETSGKYLAEESGNITATGANYGQVGTWLLDPWNVTISGGPSTYNGTFNGANPNVFTPSDTGSAVGATLIDNILNGTGGQTQANVKITTTGGGGSEAGNITVNTAGGTALSWSSTNSLTLDAVNNIILNTDITNSSSGNLILEASGTVSGPGNINLTSGSVSVAGTDGIGSAGNTTLNSTRALSLGNISSGDLTVNADGNVTQSGVLSIAGATTINAGTSDITLTDTSNDFGSQAVALTGNNLSLIDNDTNGLTLGNINATGNVSIDQVAGNDITQASNTAILMTGTNNTANFDVGSGTGQVLLGNAGNNFNGNVLNVGGGDNTVGNVTLTDDTSNVVLGNINSAGDLQVAAQGNVTQDSGTTLNDSGLTNISSTTGSIDLTTGTNSFGRFAASTTNQAISVTSTNSNLNIANETGGTGINAGTGTITLTASNGAITDNSGVGFIVAGVTNLTATGDYGYIDLENTTQNQLGTITASAAGSNNGYGIILNDSNSNGLTINNLDTSTGNGHINVVEHGTIARGSALTVNGDITAGDGSVVLNALGGGGVTGTGAITTTYSTGLYAATDSGYIDLTGDNQFSAVEALTGGTGGVTLNDVNTSGLTIDAIDTTNGGASAGGPVNVTASGALSLAATLQQTPPTISAGAGTVTLSGTSITALDPGQPGYSTGSINTSAASALTVTDGDILLTGENHLGGLITASGHNINMVNIEASQLGNMTATGNLSGTFFGALTQATGTALNVTGTTDLNAESNDVSLTNADNMFNGAVSVTGNTVSVTQKTGNDLTLENINAYGDVTVNDTGGTLTFTGSTPTIELRNGTSNNIVTLVANQFDNQNTGTDSPIDLGTGSGNAWQFYLTHFADNTFGNLVSGNSPIWGVSYPTPITQTGNRYIFAAADPSATSTPTPLNAYTPAANPGVAINTITDNLASTGHSYIESSEEIEDMASHKNRKLKIIG